MFYTKFKEIATITLTRYRNERYQKFGRVEFFL